MSNYPVIKYNKKIPIFFESLLNRISKISLKAIEADCQPSENIHYQPTKNGIIILTSSVIKLSHELAHMLEVKNNNKLLRNDYGIPSYFPETRKGQLQAVAREARTRGIQTRLVELAYGNKNLLVHRNASLLVKQYPVAKFSSAADINAWSASITKSSYLDWCENKVIETWHRKTDFINDWLETSR